MPKVIEIPTESRKTLFDRAIETQAAIEVMRPIGRGETATYGALKEKMGCNPQAGGRSNVNSARRYLQREHGMVFVAVPNVGYKRLSDTEIVKGSPNTVAKVRRETRRGSLRLTCVDYDNLSDEDKLSHQGHLTVFALWQATSKADSVKKLLPHVQETMRSLPLNQTLEAFKK